MADRYGSLAVVALLAACTTGGTPVSVESRLEDRTVGGVAYRAETLVLESFPVQLRPQVRMRNETGDDVTVTFPDGCLVYLRAYRDASRTGKPAWDQAAVLGCTAALAPVSLAAGDSTILRGPAVSAAEILGDSLPAARYFFTAVLRPESQEVELAAGEAELAT